MSDLSKLIPTTTALLKSKIPVHRERRKSISYYGSTDFLSARAALMAFAILLIASSVTPIFAQYTRTDLASNQPGVAPSTDQQHLINSWGLTALPTSPFWLSDNGSGFSTLYNGSGQQNPLFVTIPASASSPAGTTGRADSGARNFLLNGLSAATSGALGSTEADLWKSAFMWRFCWC